MARVTPQRLLNTCRWSSSREATFNECKKKYWYTYYGAWEGWPKTPYDARKEIDPLASHLYMLKNMQPACMFMGSLVHKVIEECLKRIQQTKKAPPLEDLITQTSLLYEKSIRESKEQVWKNHPKHHTNLLEHFYGLPFGPAEEATVKEKALTCITNWIASPCIQNIALHKNSEWLGIESTQTFSVADGIEAIVVYDFFLRWPRSDGSKIMIIFDWKTGQESKLIDDQLCAYALAATTLFSVPLETVLLSPFYLMAGPSGYKKYGATQENSIDVHKLATTKSRIIESSQKMLSLHQKPKDDGIVPTPDPTLFPYPEDRRGCRRCQFQQLCSAAAFEQKGSAELRELVSSFSA